MNFSGKNDTTECQATTTTNRYRVVRFVACIYVTQTKPFYYFCFVSLFSPADMRACHTKFDSIERWKYLHKNVLLTCDCRFHMRSLAASRESNLIKYSLNIFGYRFVFLLSMTNRISVNERIFYLLAFFSATLKTFIWDVNNWKSIVGSTREYAELFHLISFSFLSHYRSAECRVCNTTVTTDKSELTTTFRRPIINEC